MDTVEIVYTAAQELLASAGVARLWPSAGVR
jgi:hypothetical protein